MALRGFPSENPFFGLKLGQFQDRRTSSAVSCDHVSHLKKLPPKSRVADLALNQAAKPWSFQNFDPQIGTICGGLFRENV